MSLSTEAIRRILALKLTAEALNEVLSIFADEIGQTRQASNRRAYFRRKDKLSTESSTDSRTELGTVKNGCAELSTEKTELSTEFQPEIETPRAGALAPVLCGEESKIYPLKEPTVIIPQTEKPSSVASGKQTSPNRPSKRNDSREAICAELSVVLDGERTEAVFRYRASNGAAQTTYAARLLASEFAKTGSPNEAADLMILRNWQGFKVGWWHRENGTERPDTRAGPINGTRPQTSLLIEAVKESIEDERNGIVYDKSLF